MKSFRPVGIGIAVTTAYFLAAKLGFEFAFVAEQVTTVWAPTGIALAALLLWGRRLWPAVWLGAFLANAGTAVPLWAAALIATGNTLEAIAATSLLRSRPQFDVRLSTVRDVLAFIVVGAVLSTAIAATVGAATLCAARAQPWALFPDLWLDWWLGDALGALVVGPVFLTLARPAGVWTRPELVQTGLLVGGTVVATQIVFGQVFGSGISGHPLEFIIFPFVIIAAVRLQPAATALVVLAASAITIWNTVRGAGPFAGVEVRESLILLQTFTGVLASTGLVLAAAIAERTAGDRRRAAAHAVGEDLAAAESMTQAAPIVLKRICETLGWQLGALWMVQHDTHRLKCVAVWSDSPASTAEFVRVSHETRFPVGIGLPGRVWGTGRAAWIEDVVRDSNFPRAPAAREAGLHGAFAFPICLADEVLGVVECFNRTVLKPDSDLLQTMSTLGRQIGQFAGRTGVEGALRDGQRRTQAILDTALDAIIGMDHTGTVTDFNPAAERIFGYTAREVVGRELADLLIPPELREQHREGVRRYLASGEGPFIDRRIETTGCHARGHTFPVEVSITRVSGEDPPRFTGFVRDLTAKAQTEREREQWLQRESKARREAEAANRAKDEFLATLSHELRTPLNAIVGWTRMLLDGSLDEGSAKKALEVIDRNAHLQTRLVADILDVSRIITGGLQLNRRPMDLGSVIGAALDAVQPAANAKNIRLTSRLVASTRFHEGDAERMQQVVWNLLANAVKFTPTGGSVDVALLDSDAGGLLIRVQDDGAGIEPAFVPHVFERFRQADGSMSRQHGGLGLGLAIVRHLVELHGGVVRAESAGVGLGSTFTVELPPVDPDRGVVLDGQYRLPIEHPPVNTMPLRGCRVLVVDDEDDARELVASVLMRAGASVETAASVREALEQLENTETDVLLADIGMPIVDGYGLIREVRKRDVQRGKHLPAAAVTAYAGAEDRERALAAGFDRHVPKPVSQASILDAVTSLWRRDGFALKPAHPESPTA